tara:strand:+ start:515 stop:1213 length:699 start_codon:yes stop_codon:yes gene_type:complete
MNYLYTPPETHIDGGFGVTAINFSEAADGLRESSNPMLGILPICYLRRHSIELFLKSIILILHKKFSIPFGDGFSVDKPAILTKGNKWQLISNTHNLQDLYGYFIKVLSICKCNMPNVYCWDIPSKIKKKINLIDGYDPKSTYFRYPDSTNSTQDSKKHAVKKTNIKSISKKIRASNSAVHALLIIDENDCVVDSYEMKKSPLPDVLSSLNELNDFFAEWHYSLRRVLNSGN